MWKRLRRRTFAPSRPAVYPDQIGLLIFTLVALWVGFGLMLPYLIYAALLGGGLTLLILAIRRYPLPAGLQRHKWIDRLHDTKSGVPYGITLAIAGLLVYPETAIFTRFIG